MEIDDEDRNDRKFLHKNEFFSFATECVVLDIFYYNENCAIPKVFKLRRSLERGEKAKLHTNYKSHQSRKYHVLCHCAIVFLS